MDMMGSTILLTPTNAPSYDRLSAPTIYDTGILDFEVDWLVARMMFDNSRTAMAGSNLMDEIILQPLTDINPRFAHKRL